MKNENLKIQNDCEEVELLIDDSLEGMVSLNDKQRIDEHLASCEDCSTYMNETRLLTNKINSLPKEIVVSEEKKNLLWEKTESGINAQKNIPIKKNKVSKYKYILSGIAACIIVAVIVYAVKNINFTNVQLSSNVVPSYWKVSKVQGTPYINDVAVQSVDSMKEGQWLKTGDSTKAELAIASLGNIIIEPNSMIRLVKCEDGNNRIAIEYGTINADINSNPKTFFVELPSATAVDLGGSYTMTLNQQGDGLIFVKSGKVSLESNNKQTLVPAGNFIATKNGIGVGTPFSGNSTPEFQTALMNYDFGNCGGTCVNAILKIAKPTDAITLVNLLSKVESKYQDEVYTKAAKFVTPPVNIHNDSIPYFDNEKLNDWIEKIQEEVKENIEMNMKEVEKNMKQVEENMKDVEKNMKNIEKYELDSAKWRKDWSKNWKFKIPKEDYNFKGDSVYFDKEEFEKDMEEMKKDLKENLNNEEFKKDMEKMKEDLKDMNRDLKEDMNFNSEELKKEMEKVKEEIQKAMEEVKKNTNIEIDSANHKYKIKIKDKDGVEDEEEIEVPEVPEIEKQDK